MLERPRRSKIETWYEPKKAQNQHANQSNTHKFQDRTRTEGDKDITTSTREIDKIDQTKTLILSGKRSDQRSENDMLRETRITYRSNRRKRKEKKRKKTGPGSVEATGAGEPEKARGDSREKTEGLERDCFVQIPIIF